MDPYEGLQNHVPWEQRNHRVPGPFKSSGRNALQPPPDCDPTMLTPLYTSPQVHAEIIAYFEDFSESGYRLRQEPFFEAYAHEFCTGIDRTDLEELPSPEDFKLALKYWPTSHLWVLEDYLLCYVRSLDPYFSRLGCRFLQNHDLTPDPRHAYIDILCEITVIDTSRE
ncbi:hypothetical protein BJ508DRAFT_331287 [Ascobolus immersus RN42]|uniref:Uncharacterized protein n=1 Tax=Ascobolus immersus RN42 TaxID=1160509 RepID=A0A3N4HRI1_ASCIM|nr:hypothetical protein BJ508DRAFT_331287 [Ascobolus immersus RN42]